MRFASAVITSIAGVLVLVGCGSGVADEGSSKSGANGAAEEPGPAAATKDGGAPNTDGSEPTGPRIWFDSSIAIESSTYTSFDGPLGVKPSSSTGCARWSRAVLSDAELAGLSELRLENLVDSCSADGYSSVTVTVYDADGSKASFHEQSSYPTCGSSASPSPMLPSGSIEQLRSDASVACP